MYKIYFMDDLTTSVETEDKKRKYSKRLTNENIDHILLDTLSVVNSRLYCEQGFHEDAVKYFDSVGAILDNDHPYLFRVKHPELETCITKLNLRFKSILVSIVNGFNYIMPIELLSTEIFNTAKALNYIPMTFDPYDFKSKEDIQKFIDGIRAEELEVEWHGKTFNKEPQSLDELKEKLVRGLYYNDRDLKSALTNVGRYNRELENDVLIGKVRDLPYTVPVKEFGELDSCLVKKLQEKLPEIWEKAMVDVEDIPKVGGSIYQSIVVNYVYKDHTYTYVFVDDEESVYTDDLIYLMLRPLIKNCDQTPEDDYEEIQLMLVNGDCRSARHYLENIGFTITFNRESNRFKVMQKMDFLPRFEEAMKKQKGDYIQMIDEYFL